MRLLEPDAVFALLPTLFFNVTLCRRGVCIFQPFPVCSPVQQSSPRSIPGDDFPISSDLHSPFQPQPDESDLEFGSRRKAFPPSDSYLTDALHLLEKVSVHTSDSYVPVRIGSTFTCFFY